MYHIVYDETLISLRNNAPQKIRIAVDTANESFELTQSNLTQGSCSVDRYCCSGERIEIGSAIAAELKLALKNEVITYNGQKYNLADITFEGAEMRPFCLVPSIDGSYEEIPLGVFTVDEPPRKLSTITIKALDRMMRFDVAHDGTVGSSLLVIVQHCCDLAGVMLSSSAITFLNRFAGVYTLPESIADKEDLVCRQVLMWVGEMTASCAYIDENGYLDFKQYPKSYTDAMVITEADRYSSDMQESDITITGIAVTPTDSESEAVTIGAQGYEWNIEGNQLLASPDEMASAPLGYSNDAFFSYRPFKANTKSFPHLWPLDAIVFSKRNSDGVSVAYNSVITHHTWKLNGSSAISAVGKTATKNGYATHGGFTAKQKAVLERAVKGQVKTQISGYQQAILDINKQAQGALGLYSTTDENTGITYYHNQPDIADSTYIYMESTAGRFMATGVNAWNGGSPVWTNAWTSMGQIVAHSMAAGSITTDMLSVGAAANVCNNLFLNGDFSNDTYTWFKGSDWKNGEMIPDDHAKLQSAYMGNANDLKISIPVGEYAMRILVGTYTALLSNVICNQKISVTPGKEYTASFYVKRQSSSDNRKAQMCLNWYNSSDEYISSGYADAVYSQSTAQSWQRFSNTVSAPSNASYAIVKFYLYDETGSSTYDNCYVYIAGLMLEEGSKLHDWDDGEHQTSSNVIIDRAGIDIYNGAFNLYAPNGQNVIHFDADNSLNIDANGSLSITLNAGSEQYKSTGNTRVLIKLPTTSSSVNLETLIADKVVYAINEAMPHIQLVASDIVGDEEGSVSPSAIYVNPYGLHIEDSTVSSGYFSELQSGRLYFKNGNSYSRLTAGQLNLSGTIFSKNTAVSSSESIKTNITEAESMLDKICAAGIYSYNYVSDTESDTSEGSSSGGIVEEGGNITFEPASTHYGLVIGEGYNTPDEVISEDGAHIDLYSMISLAWKAIQELAAKLNSTTPTEVT